MGTITSRRLTPPRPDYPAVLPASGDYQETARRIRMQRGILPEVRHAKPIVRNYSTADIDKVIELQHIHITDGNRTLKGITSTPIIKRRLTRGR